ncbi:MAG: hypothetical protein HY901_17785 [Deltaproteobacteria bacterium]|nr:hypothetical protein [Deltaproteobacteria bacterium]
MALESAETQPHLVGGAEISSLPDGSCSIRLATAQAPLLARAFLGDRAPAAVVLLGPAPFGDTMLDLCGRLAARGASALMCFPRPGAQAPAALRSTVAFLRGRGARRVAAVGAADSALAVLQDAAAIDLESVLLLGPREVPQDPPCDLTRGRPLVVCTGSDTVAVRRLSRLPHVTFLQFPGASETFEEVRSDLAAGCLPALLRSLGLTAVDREA